MILAKSDLKFRIPGLIGNYMGFVRGRGLGVVHLKIVVQVIWTKYSGEYNMIGHLCLKKLVLEAQFSFFAVQGLGTLVLQTLRGSTWDIWVSDKRGKPIVNPSAVGFSRIQRSRNNP